MTNDEIKKALKAADRVEKFMIKYQGQELSIDKVFEFAKLSPLFARAVKALVEERENLLEAINVAKHAIYWGIKNGDESNDALNAIKRAREGRRSDD